MNVQIPIAGITLVDNETYDGQLPVWATRPLMIRIKPDFISGNEYPVYIQVVNGGGVKKLVTLPYQEELDVDLSFAAPLLTRADRNKSEGDPAFPQQLVNIWSSDINVKVTLPVFHCDETYWDTLGVDSALPQPPKPRIPGQTLDIYFPYRIHPLDAFQVEIEPVTGAPSSAIFPTTYVLGNTIDITYIKKLTIKNVWGSGLDQVINYEDRLMSDVVYDESLQCALRARWNMRNGQWFWAAFKDYFWSNKFTLIRGRGGVTEQAEITINLEYGEEWYNVYQELLVSSNVVFDLNLPGINQYQNKRFEAEVMGDTGARWSNSTKTYRQQVRFRTTELTDNYMFPPAPDQPPTPAIQFSALVNPWLNASASYMEEMWNNIYSNAAWEVQSKPDWYSFGDMITLTPNDFEQGGLTGAPGTSYEDMKFTSNSYIRSKNPIPIYGKPVFIRAFVPGFNVTMYAFDANMTFISGSNLISGANQTKTVSISGAVYAIFRLQREPLSNITPSDATAAQIGVADNSIYTRIGKAGTQYIYGTIAPNPGDARTGNIVLKSKAGATTYTILIKQAGVTNNITATPSTIAAGYVHIPVTVAVTAFGTWSISQRDPWITPSQYNGPNGTTDVTLTIGDNTTTDARTGTITFYDHITQQIAVVTVNQDGKPTSINIDPTKVTAPKTSGTFKQVICGSINGWAVTEKPSWVAVAPNNDAAGLVPIGITYTANSTGAKRSGYLEVTEIITGEIAICIIEQEG
nr:MAG: Protein of unknown function (DUF722) [Bacteriophage sp.]